MALYTPEYKPNGNEIAVLTTSKGTIRVQLAGNDAPIHVGNFVELSQKGYYDGLKFHRYVPGFVIQGGCPNTRDLTPEQVINEGSRRGCGTGNPFFSTDTAAVLRAAEIGAAVILLAKNIDGVYDCDPAKNANAVKFDAITYDEVLKRRLAVMDSTATSLSMDNHIPVLVFALKDPYNIVRALRGEKIGTIVKEA